MEEFLDLFQVSSYIPIRERYCLSKQKDDIYLQG